MASLTDVFTDGHIIQQNHSGSIGAHSKIMIKNTKTGGILGAQYNPEGFQYTRGVTYSTLDAPGMSYPETQFVKGNIREFPVKLFFFDKPDGTMYPSLCNFLGGFLTPEYNTPTYQKPPEMIFAFGTWVRTCVMTELDINITEYNRLLKPVMYTMEMTLRQVGV